jgi:integrase
MAIHPPRVLAEEELFLLQTIIDKAKVVRADGATSIVVPANQMLVDLLKALRLIDETGERQARLPQVAQSNPSEILRPSGQTTLAEACAKFLDRGPIWGQGTIDHYARVTRLLIDVLGGHAPIRGVTPDDLIRVKNVSMALPAQYHAHYSHMPMEKAVAAANKKGVKPRALSTVGRELYGIQVFFNWCLSQWIIERNPAQGIALPRRLTRSERAREAFLITDLNKMFKAPIYTGCRNDGWFFSTVGDSKPRNARFWLPLIALYSGMRLGEIAQLTSDNVIEIEGILCFKIRPTVSPNGEDVLLKTNAAMRNIPVHSELMKIGLAEYFRGKKGRLFPELTAPTVRKRTTYYSRWFSNRFLASVGISGRMVSFHSFRHNFRDALREGNVQHDFVNMLGGWAPRTASNKYGGGRAPVLKREIEKVSYPGLDLSHLYWDAEGKAPLHD